MGITACGTEIHHTCSMHGISLDRLHAAVFLYFVKSRLFTYTNKIGVKSKILNFVMFFLSTYIMCVCLSVCLLGDREVPGSIPSYATLVLLFP